MDVHIRPELRDKNNPGRIYTSWNKTFLSLFGCSKNRHKLYDGRQEALIFVEKLLTNLQRAHIPKCLMCFQVKNKMASRPRRNTTEEVRDEVFADPASDFDDESSSNESEEYSPQHSSSESDESSENEVQQSINNENQHARGRGHGHGHFLHTTIRQEHLK